MSRARHRGSTGCHRGAKWCSMARRVATDRLTGPSSGGNAKTPRLIARNSPTKQSSTTYHFINLSSLRESAPSPSLHCILTPRLQISLKSVTNRAPPRPLPRAPPPPLSAPLPNLVQVHLPFSAALKPLIPSWSSFVPSLPPTHTSLSEFGLHAIRQSIKPPPDIPINSATRQTRKLKSEHPPLPSAPSSAAPFWSSMHEVVISARCASHRAFS